MGIEEQDKTLTRQGFLKGQHLTDTHLDGILERLAAGDTPGRACRTQGTSFTQFIRRVQKDPELGGALPEGGGRGTGRPGVRWQVSDRADPVARKIADRHYNRQSVGATHFVPPGRCLVLRTPTGDAFWVTSWPFAEYVRHAWGGAWVCSAFRNESPHLSSELVLEALAATRAVWEPPDLGMITFVNADKVRKKRDPGRCFRKAGFVHVGFTKSGLYAFQLLPDAMPDAEPPIGTHEMMDLGI